MWTLIRAVTELALALALVVLGVSVVHDTWYVQTDGGFEQRQWAMVALASVGLALGGVACTFLRRPWTWTWAALTLAATAAVITQIGYVRSYSAFERAKPSSDFPANHPCTYAFRKTDAP